MAGVDGLEVVELSVPLSIAPSASEHLHAAVEEHLNELLMKFQPDTQGVLLSVSRARVPAAGVVVGLSPFLHFNVAVQGLMFSPRIGGSVPLTVAVASEGHLSGLVLGAFNATLPAELLPQGSTWLAASEEWALPDGRQVGAGATLTVRVLDLHVAGGALSMVATLRSSPAPPAAAAAGAGAVPAPVRRGTKRALEAAEEEAPALQGAGGGAPPSPPAPGTPPPKRSRKAGGGSKKKRAKSKKASA